MRFGRAVFAIAVVGLFIAAFIAACSVNDVTPTPNVDSGADATTDVRDGGFDATSSDVADVLGQDVVKDAAPEAIACDASTLTDPANCGTCGHPCLGSDGGGAPYCNAGEGGIE